MRWLACCLIALGSAPAGRALPAAGPPPPETRRDELREVLHGVEIADPYRWLEDQEDSETREWLHRQREYLETVLAAAPGREALERRVAELLHADTPGLPQERGGRYFFTRRAADEELAVLYVRHGRDGRDEVLVDPHDWGEGYEQSVELLSVSRDGRLIAYGVRDGGEDEFEVRFMEVDSRRELPDRLPKARYGSVAIKPDKGGAYYVVRIGPRGPVARYHHFGSPADDYYEVFGWQLDAEKGLSLEISDSGRYLLLTVSHGAGARRQDLYYQDLSWNGAVTPIVNSIDARFSAAVAGDRLYIQTDWEAPRGRIMATGIRSVRAEQWEEIIPEGEGTIRGFTLAGGKLCVTYLEDAVPRVRLFELDGSHVADLELPHDRSVSAVSGRWASDELFLSASTFHAPPAIYRFELSTARRSVWDEPPPPVAPDAVEVTQVWYRSRDGTRVPLFLAHRRDLPRDGDRPALLTGYGGFNIARPPAYSPLAAAWIEAGGVYALANLRGGGEFGEAWHRAGRRENKQNGFDDFIAAAEWLIANNYTRPERLAISGASNGGLLVGAALTQRPELFQAVVCSVPLLDMLRYHRFLLGRLWVPEYGSADDPEQFRTLLEYSPYHRVAEGTAYPAVLFITGDADTRVAPLHARKMTARLQHATSSDRPVLLSYENTAGHSRGGRSRSRSVEDLTRQLHFLFWQLGVEPPAAQ